MYPILYKAHNIRYNCNILHSKNIYIHSPPIYSLSTYSVSSGTGGKRNLPLLPRQYDFVHPFPPHVQFRVEWFAFSPNIFHLKLVFVRYLTNWRKWKSYDPNQFRRWWNKLFRNAATKEECTSNRIAHVCGSQTKRK